jgi:diguanylate cyclase (GGDEF)-like protein/PAS domain S-box-containing protein
MAGVSRLVAPRDAEALAARWRAFVDESPIAIYELGEEDQCVFVNAAFERLTGIVGDDALGDGWRRAFHADDVATVGEQRAEACRVRVVRPDGEQRWASVRSLPLDGGSLVTLEDVTDRQRLEDQLAYDASHDRLTGLGSRALLNVELAAALSRARRAGSAVALLFIDLDGFKRVNDMLGHAAGDELLVQVAQRLRESVRDADVCVRLGGDEFVVCCTDMATLDHASTLADRLLAAVSEPYDVHGHEVLVGASIGIATAQGEDPASVDQLLSNADMAAYRAKRMGRGRVEIFDEDLRRRLARGRRTARAIGSLLDQPRLPLLCTPIAQLGEREHQVVGFDCAVDWERAGLPDADDVALVVEETGMSRALDIAVVRTVLAQLADWEREPPGPIVPGLGAVLTRVGALAPVMPEVLRDMLVRSGVNPALCWIGVPESAVAQDVEAASRVVVALDELRVGVALRDFGSAVSSLDQLRRLPARTMTIAGPLVEAVHASEDDAQAALLRAIVNYARSLGRIVVAGGVHDVEHAARLRQLGCAFGAGPAFGPVVRADQVTL